jgi:hypothetical protein
MSRLSRLVLGAALVVGMTAPTARAAEPDKLLPADADTVAVINIRQILDSDVVKKYAIEQLKQMLDGADMKRLMTSVGLDPLKDIEKIVAASIETKFAKGAEPQFLLIVHGKFDAEKIYRTAEAESKKDADKFAMIKDGNTVMFKYQGAEGQPPVYATVVNDKTVVAASEKKLITNALKAADSSKPAPIKKDLAELLKKMDEKTSVFVASILKGKLDELKLPGGGGMFKLDDLEKVIPKIETATVAVKVGTDIVLEATIGMKDEEAAGDMRNALDDVLKQLGPLAKTAGSFDPKLKPLGDIVAGIKTSSKNKDVTVTGKVTSQQIGQLANKGGD